MIFTAPVWLWLGGLGLLVLAFHLRHRRTIEVPSIQLWRLLDGGIGKRRSIRQPPLNHLLLLQLLAVVLAVLALARPGFATRFAHEIVVVDGSGTMRTTDVVPSRFDAAFAQIADIASAATEAGARVSVIVAAARPQIVAARLTDVTGLREQLGQQRAGDGVADWAAIARLATSVRRDGEATRLVLITDRADRAGHLIEAMPGVTIESRLVGSTRLRNAGLRADLHPVGSNGETWRADGAVTFAPGFSGTATVTALVEPAGGDGFLDWGSVDVRPSSSAAETRFSLDLDLKAPSAVILRLADDDGPQDNSVQFVVRPKPRAIKVLMLGPASEPLARALRAAAEVDLLSADLLPADVAAFDLVIVNDIEVPSRPETNVLWLGSGHAAGIVASEQPAAVPDLWQSDHPLSRSVDWDAVRPQRAYRFSGPPGSVRLLEAKGTPLVEAGTTMSGRDVRLAFDLGKANWAELPGFPIFVSNLLHWIAPDLGRTRDAACEVGTPCSLDPRLLGADVALAASRDAGATLIMSRQVGLVPGGFDSPFVPDRAGLYRLSRNGLTRYLAVNAMSEPVPGVAARTPAPSRQTPWRWLLIACFAVLATEAWLAGRGPERFLRPAALATGNPLAWRRRAALGLRVTALVLIALALAGVPVASPSHHQNLVVVTGPALMPEDEKPVDTGVGAANIAVVAAGETGSVVSDLGEPPGRTPVASAADLETALATAAALIPASEGGRIAVVFDGNETRGNAALQFPSLVRRGIPIDVLPTSHLRPGEVLVEEVSAPRRIYAGDSFPLRAVIYGEGHTTGSLRVLKDGKVIVERPLDLPGGRHRVEIVIPAAETGRARYEVALDAIADTFAANNRDGVIVDVAQPPRVLIVAGQPSWGDVFAGALKIHGIDAKVVESKRAPYYIKDWLAYETIVLMNVPAIDLTTQQQELIEKAVAEHGRGLLLLGGENSFGPGGYYETALERLSPLSSRVPREAPRIALVFVLDRSGSMQRDEGGATRLDIAKQATLAAVRLLHPQSQIAIVVFDSEAKVVLPLSEAKNTAAILQALRGVEPGGGTAIHPGLVEALHQMAGSDAAAKHIVVMSDGLTQPGDFPGILQAIAEQNISVSTVSIGDAADPVQLLEIARLGKGAFHTTRDFKALPSILSQEALLLSGKPVEERTVAPTWVTRNGEFFAGLPDQMPPLAGYVLTTRKPEADLHLVVFDEKHEPVPLLASWRYGSGRVVALSTHGAGAWSKEWQAMPDYPLLWSQTVRRIVPGGGEGIWPQVTRRGDAFLVDVDALDPAGLPRQGLAVTAAFDSRQIGKLTETSPGHYHGEIMSGTTGEAVLHVAAGGMTVERALPASYPALYRFTAADHDRLAAVATLTGGRILASANEMVGPPQWRWIVRAGWPWWVLLALAAFVGDLAVRYVPGLVGFRRAGQKI